MKLSSWNFSRYCIELSRRAGRFAKNDKKHFYVIARGSAYEVVAIIKFMKKHEMMEDEVFKEFVNQLEEVIRLIAGLVNRMVGE